MVTDGLASNVELHPSGDNPSMAEKDCSGPTILLVEDEALIRMALADCLSDAGYRVLEADDPKQARTIVRAGARIALLISDVNLRGMNGIALAREMAQEVPELKIVVISGEPANAAPAAKLGYFLHKPFRPERLVSLVHGLLGPAPRFAGPRAV
jgi:DNA-binding NtrC family response regulator